MVHEKEKEAEGVPYKEENIMTDPKKPTHKSAADKNLQSKMEGKDTPFQRDLRASEAGGAESALTRIIHGASAAT